MSETNTSAILSLINTKGRISADDVAKAFDDLLPVTPDELIDNWKGGSLDTGHPGHAQMLSMNWAGKDFISIDDVHPIVLYDEAGRRRYAQDVSGGPARLREVKFRGVVSAAMIYDAQPVIDHFRKVDENMVVGAMDTRFMAEAGTYYFYLTRL